MMKTLFFSLSLLLAIALTAQQEGKIIVEGETPSDTSSIIVKPDRIDMFTPGLYWNDELIGTGDGGQQMSGDNTYNLLWSYDAEMEEQTGSDDYMFIDALSKANRIFIPHREGYAEGEVNYVITGDIVIPAKRQLAFEYDAKVDVEGSLKGNKTLIDAGPYQIFTVTSNLSDGRLDWARRTVPRPEWFGAEPDSVTNCTPGIQKCLDVFKTNILMNGRAYRLESSILIDEPTSIFMFPLSFLIAPDNKPDGQQDDPVYRIEAEPFVINGGVIKCEQGYNGWVFDVAVTRTEQINDAAPRFASRISNLIVKGFLYGQNDFSGLAHNGIRVKSWKANDYSYFSVMENVDFYRPDTAIYLAGHPESGMSNSWHWNNITIDWTMHGIYLNEKAAGHVFTNLIMQPNTRKPAGENPILTVAGKYNSFNGVIWDIHYRNTIHLLPTAEENWFSHMGRTDIYDRFTLDEATPGKNVFTTATPFQPTQNYYSYYGMERMMLGIRDNRSSNVPRFAVYSYTNNDAVVASFIEKWYGVGGNSNLETTNLLKPSINLQARTSNSSMINGFGSGITFSIKDTQSDTTAYSTDLIGRIFARRDGADNQGLMQFFTKGSNASAPSMTIRNSGNVGIGTTNPQALLHVAGDLIVDGTITNGPNKAVDANTVTINEVLSLTPRSTPPANPKAGDLYVGTDGHIYCYLLGNWKPLDN
ncbi:MAG: hypothetical protein P8100_08235 [bacterium]